MIVFNSRFRFNDECIVDICITGIILCHLLYVFSNIAKCRLAMSMECSYRLIVRSFIHLVMTRVARMPRGVWGLEHIELYMPMNRH